jgi:prolipoprotein diacylglyceryltransferase
MTNENKQSSFSTIFKVGLTCVLIGGFIGAITNMINGAISPNYFRIVMGWNFQEIWIASVAQGILEGLIHGVIFSAIFTTGFGIITQKNGSYNFAIKQLSKIILMVLTCWAIGGLISMMLAFLSPDFYHSHYYNAPKEKSELLKYSWVGGSIWGGTIGGFLSAIFGIVIIKNNWRETNTK